MTHTRIVLKRTATGVVCVHVAWVVAFLCVTWGLGMDFVSILICNAGRLGVVLLPLSALAGLALLPSHPARKALLTLGVAAFALVSPLWAIAAMWTLSDLQSGNGDRPDVSIDLGDGTRLVYFTTYDAGALGGAYYKPAHVRPVFPGLERRDWWSPEERRDSTGWPVAVVLHGRTIPLPNLGGLKRVTS